jgi:hypothetical protein
MLLPKAMEQRAWGMAAGAESHRWYSFSYHPESTPES